MSNCCYSSFERTAMKGNIPGRRDMNRPAITYMLQIILLYYATILGTRTSKKSRVISTTEMGITIMLSVCNCVFPCRIKSNSFISLCKYLNDLDWITNKYNLVYCGLYFTYLSMAGTEHSAFISKRHLTVSRHGRTRNRNKHSPNVCIVSINSTCNSDIIISFIEIVHTGLRFGWCIEVITNLFFFF